MFLDDFLQLVLEDFTLTGYIKLIEKLRRVSFISSIIVSAPKSGYYLIFSEGGGAFILQGYTLTRLFVRTFIGYTLSNRQCMNNMFFLCEIISLTRVSVINRLYVGRLFL